jgi:uncharacterized tellurite resistance protein B-like protein
MPQDRRLRLFRNLVAAAAVDGEIADAERKVLAYFARGLGVGEAEYLTAVVEATSGALKLVVPKEAEERAWMIGTLEKVIEADGRVTEREIGLYRAFARRVGVDPSPPARDGRAPAPAPARPRATRRGGSPSPGPRARRGKTR